LSLDKITLFGKINDLPSVKSLASTYPQLSELLHSIYDFSSFNKFVKDHGHFLQSENLNVELLTEKSRLCTLVNFCALRENVSYSDIKDLIDVDIDDVERWVIKANSKKLMRAQLDQLEQIIVVLRASPVSYNKETWEFLLSRTKAWKSNMEVLAKSINQ